MKRYTILPLLLLVVATMLPILAGCQHETPSPNPPASITTEGNTRVYTNYQYGFTFTICNSQEFEAVENLGGAAIALLGPTLGDMKSRIGVYVIANKAPKNIKLEDYVRDSRKNAEKILANFTIEKESTTTIGGIEAQQTLYTYTATIGEHDYTFRNALIVFIKDNNAYAIKYETPDEFYDEYSDCFDLLISTFKFR
jgi:hypothetical protein